jgi:hypothetical protein
MKFQGLLSPFTIKRPRIEWYTELVQFTHSHRTLLKSASILSSQIHFGLPNDPVPSGFLTKFMDELLVSLMRATFSAHLFIFNLINIIILSEQQELWRSSLQRNFLDPPLIPSLTEPNIFLSPLISDNPNIFLFPQNERSNVTHLLLYGPKMTSGVEWR